MWPLFGVLTVAFNVFTHKLAEHLSCGLVLHPASLQKCFATVAVDSYSWADILHSIVGVSNGYRFV
jgi:hypothetical protein